MSDSQPRPQANEQRNAPAFPCQNDNSCGDLMPGLTKRELFAAMAMQGILAHGVNMLNEGKNTARWAVHNADELLTALLVTKETP